MCRPERGRPHFLDANQKLNPNMNSRNEKGWQNKMIWFHAWHHPTPQHLEEPGLEALKPLLRQTVSNQTGPRTTWDVRYGSCSHGTSAL
ncbi:hypothetical protein N9L68_03330 [bacterium]|nr:hypothetical protein [bacterium]